MSQTQSLSLRGHHLSADNLAHLRQQTGLTALALDETDLTDAGLERLGDLTNLRVLNLSGTKISDAGLSHLRAFKQLRFLILNQTRVSDEGLAWLASLSQLEFLGLNGTAVSAEGARQLKQLLGDCDIVADFADAAAPAETARLTTLPMTHETSDDVESLPPAACPTTSGDTIPDHFGRYYIIKTLGQGRMGTVFLAHDEQLDRKVALKIPRLSQHDGREVRDRFFQEARLAAKLHHRNICPVFDVGEIEGRPFIALAYIEGRELTQFIQSSQRQSETVVARVVRKLALALREAHANGILHYDLKPANVMIDRQKEPVVMDFGLARIIAEGEAGTAESGSMPGTPAYMSPEQIAGRTASLGPQSDVFSLGVLFYELLTGSLPFQGGVNDVLAQIVDSDPRPPSELRPGLNPDLEAICLRMLEKRIEDRYKSMGGVAVAISEYLKSAG